MFVFAIHFRLSLYLQASGKPRSTGSRDTDGFEVVTSNAKRKKKLRKLQKVDPSILGKLISSVRPFDAELY